MSWKRVRFTLVACALSVAAAATAEPLAPRPYLELRHRALAESDSLRANAELDSLVRSYDGDGEIWGELAERRAQLGRYEAAASAFGHAFELGYVSRPEMAYRAGRCYALAGQADSAFAWLDRSVGLGFERRPELEHDEALAPLRSDPRFRALAGMLPDRPFTRDEGWRYDVDHLMGEIRRMHFYYRWKPLPAALVDGARALRERIPSLTDIQITLEMQRLLALLGDGHSTLYVTAGERFPLRRVPIQLHTFAEGIYVVDAPESHGAWIGARVERVGAHPIADVVRRLEPYMSKDNKNAARVLGPYFATFPGALHALGLVPDADALPLTVITRDGKRQTATFRLAPAAGGDPHAHVPKLLPARFDGAPAAPRYLAHVGDHYWFESLSDSVVYWQFNQVIDGPEESLRAFSVRLRRYLDEHRTRVLIVDVRHNNGGNGSLLTTPLRTLIHFETTRPGARVFVITGDLTFSATQVFIAQADRITNAIFVGETSGSSPTFVGEDTELRLPWSGTRGSISSRLHQIDSTEERTWIPPEIPVPARASDWLAGRDAALEAVLSVIQP